MLKVLFLALCACFVCVLPLCFVGCGDQTIKMYDVSSKKIIKLKLEDYVAGVATAEMGESFATSAIEAQSVIARTYAMWFKNNNKSKYEGADISNDITEAQAYTDKIPQKVKDACNRTKGQVLKYQNNLILPYYCANCGGRNSLATDVFINNKSDYLVSVEGLETAENSQNYNWTTTIEKSTILYAMQNLGKNLASVNSFKIGSLDQAGRALTFVVGGITVNANAFRLAAGSTLIKSCKITDIKVNTSNVVLSGVGYGHGVGLSQWGANILANQNKSYKDILMYYFSKCQITKI